MAYITLKELFKATCDSLRNKLGTTDKINHQDIASKIDNIKTSLEANNGVLETHIIQKNIKLQSPQQGGLLDIELQEYINKFSTNYWMIKNSNLYLFGYIRFTIIYPDGTTEISGQEPYGEWGAQYTEFRLMAQYNNHSQYETDYDYLENGDLSCNLKSELFLENFDNAPSLSIDYRIDPIPEERKSGGRVSAIELCANLLVLRDYISLDGALVSIT